MTIAIIGAGNVGTALASGWYKATHTVCLGVRNPHSDKTKKTLAELSALPVLTIDEAIAAGEIIVIATPPDAIHDVIPFLQDASEKIVIDTTNALRARPEGYATVYHAIKALTPCKHVVKCFNSTGFENMKQPVYRQAKPIWHELQLDMFAAGDSAVAKEVCRELAKEIGFGECYDFGGSEKVELLEQFAFAWINMAIMQGMGRDMAFKLIRRQKND